MAVLFRWRVLPHAARKEDISPMGIPRLLDATGGKETVGELPEVKGTVAQSLRSLRPHQVPLDYRLWRFTWSMTRYDGISRSGHWPLPRDRYRSHQGINGLDPPGPDLARFGSGFFLHRIRRASLDE